MTRTDILDMIDDGALDAKEVAQAGLKYLSTDDRDELAILNGWDDLDADSVYDLLDEDILEASEVVNAVLQYLSTDDVADLAVTNGWDDDIFDEEIGEPEDDEYEFDPDEEEARKFMPGGEYDESDSDAEEGGDPDDAEARKFMPGGEYDEDIYYDPVDGYRDTEGFHNSIEEAEDDYYENDYKVNIPEDDE